MRRAARGHALPSVTNIALTQGAATREDLLRDMGTGLLVTSMIGSTINPNTGDYSRGASGLLGRGGADRLSRSTNAPSRGNLRDMLRRIVPANDARPTSRGSCPRSSSRA
jgi:PmbA protein